MKRIEHPLSERSRAALAAATVAFGSLAFGPVGSAQSTMDVLHSFGAMAQPATPSYGTLLEMQDGTKYGTTTAGAGAIYKLSPDGLGGFSLSVHYSFSGPDGRKPYGGLIDGGDSFLYGVTYHGGGAEAGTVFRIDLDGRLTTLHSFLGTDGANPWAGLLDIGDGNLYGTTTTGTVFRLAKNGASFQTLRTFQPGEGTNPRGTLAYFDGFLYGTTNSGNGYPSDYGTLFRIRPDGTGFARLHVFKFLSTGGQPQGGLLAGPDGSIYGTTQLTSKVFRFDPATGILSVLHSFTSAEGSPANGGLALGDDGWLHGTTSGGGASLAGTLFRIHPQTLVFELLRSFSTATGKIPLAGLVKGGDGFFYGTASTSGPLPLGAGTVYRVREDGTGFSVVATMDAATIQGQYPAGGVVLGSNGQLFGTTSGGGATSSYGTAFRLSTDGSGFTSIHSFDEATGGFFPNGLLHRLSDGLLYGMTSSGTGLNSNGIVFRIDQPGSAFANLHAFTVSDGKRPKGGLLDGGDGFLYGLTSLGGDFGGGTLFRLDPSSAGPLEVLHSFPNGSEPQGSLLRVGSSVFGATKMGGDNFTGSIFRFDLSLRALTTLHSFAGPDGRYPIGGLIMGPDGLLYGSANSGGVDGNSGTLFRIAVDGSPLELLHSFNGVDGRSPDGPLVVGDLGYLYGTTRSGGFGGVGTAFALKPATVPGDSVVSLLHAFNPTDGRGAAPIGPLLQLGDGRLYGTTVAAAGTDGRDEIGGGTVYRLSPPAHVQPTAEVTVCRDETGPTLVAATAGPASTYQWGYRWPLGTSVTAIVGQIGPTYTVDGTDFPELTYDAVLEVVCTIRYADDYGESTSNPVTVTVRPACGGGSAVSSPVRVFTATTANGASSTTLHWLNPSTVVDEIVIRYRTDGTYPASMGDSSALLLCGLGAASCGSAAADSIGSFVHSTQTPGTTYSYGIFTRSLTVSSGGKFASATPIDGPSMSAWVYSTGATSVVPPGLRPSSGGTPGAVYTVSNDRGLHAMTLGTTGGDWPAGWKPLLMNAPSQGRPIPVNFPTSTVNGVSRVVYVTSQDGRVYVADALTGALLRASAQICQGIQHSPGAMLKDYGGAYDVLIVGSRNTTTANPATNTLFGLNPDTLEVLWTFDNGAGANGIGIISGQPLVDYATNRVYFTSRQLAGGSGSSVWCLSFTETSATKVWEANVGSVDTSVTLSNGTLYVGNLDGNVHALNASNGSSKWTAPFSTADGPVRSLVWSSATGSRLFFSTTTKSWAITDNGPGTAPTAYWVPPPAIASPSNPLVYTGNAYIGTGTGQLLQLDATTSSPPAPIAVTLTPQHVQVGRPTIDSATGVIYVGTDEGRVHAASYPF